MSTIHCIPISNCRVHTSMFRLIIILNFKFRGYEILAHLYTHAFSDELSVVRSSLYIKGSHRVISAIKAKRLIRKACTSCE